MNDREILIHPEVAKAIDTVTHSRGPIDVTVGYQALQRHHEQATSAIRHLTYKLERVAKELAEDWRPGTDRGNGTKYDHRGGTLTAVRSLDLVELERTLAEINADRTLILALEARELERPTRIILAHIPKLTKGRS